MIGIPIKVGRSPGAQAQAEAEASMGELSVGLSVGEVGVRFRKLACEAEEEPSEPRSLVGGRSEPPGLPGLPGLPRVRHQPSAPIPLASVLDSVEDDELRSLLLEKRHRETFELMLESAGLHADAITAYR